jgi:threonine dehydrogenase-like Zn-dependent dehydrogenase
MRAVTLEPRKPGSLKLEEIPEPGPSHGSILVRTRAIGVCGTDRELVDGRYGEAPPGRRRLMLGHESLGRVVEAPPQSAFAIGDSVVGIVRHPDLITRRVLLTKWQEAYEKRPGDVKTVMLFED